MARAVFRLDDAELIQYKNLDLLHARIALTVYAAALLATALSIRFDAEFVFLFIAASVVSGIAWLVLVGKAVRRIDDPLRAIEPLTRFVMVAVRCLLPPAADPGARALYTVFAATGLGYLGLQAALLMGI